MKTVLEKLARREELSEREMEQAMDRIMTGGASDAQIGGFLIGMRMKGETERELLAAAQVMREKSLPVQVEQPNAVDTCGTGGDQAQTFNVSTAAAFVTAAAGVPVVKHGNRSVSSRCGSADVLEALGVPLDLTPEETAQCAKELNLAFLFAPRYHQAMKFVKEVRGQLGVRTLFNVLGPLTNPARVKHQVLGVFAPELTEILAAVLRGLGAEQALVVHGLDGLDELTVTGPTKVTELKAGQLTTYYLEPEDLGLPRGKKEELAGQDGAANARIIREIFQGEKGTKRNMVLYNAGAGIYVGKGAATLQEGIRQAAEVIDRGLALEKLNQLVEWRPAR